MSSQAPSVPDERLIRFVVGDSLSGGLEDAAFMREMAALSGAAQSTGDHPSSSASNTTCTNPPISGGDALLSHSAEEPPHLVLPYLIAKASPTVTNIVSTLEEMTNNSGSSAADGEQGKEHVISIIIDEPLTPTQQVLNVIGEYLQMNSRRAFTEVPKPVRESVLDTLRPEEAKFLHDKVLSVDSNGAPTDSVGAVPENVHGSSSAGAAPSATMLSTSGADAVANSPPSAAAHSSNLSTTALTLTMTAGGTATGPAASSSLQQHPHLFKLRVLKAALFLQLSPLAAAISGWFAFEMAKLVSCDTKATKNAAKLRGFLGVEEDFTEEEKVIIDRHTAWPGRY